MQINISPFAPQKFPKMPEISGVEFYTASTGIKYKARPDLLLVSLAQNSVIAGVFTRSHCPGAPVKWSKQVLANNGAGGILVNAGNANVFTGAQGEADVKSMAEMAAKSLNSRTDEIYICSTGVIGEPLDLPPIAKAFDEGLDKASWRDAAQAICTTDTYLKAASAKFFIGNEEIHIGGIAKGSGMIAPDMATMLGFIFTNANIEQRILQELLSDCAKTSFNAISVDGDTSTSDTVLLAATGRAKMAKLSNINNKDTQNFKQALLGVMQDLAKQIIKDGEGISKLFSVNISGAQDTKSAKIIAMNIANSPLVKTAIAGEDANWGRIIMAIGKSGQKIDMNRLIIRFGRHLVAEKGARAKDYNEAILSKYMQNDELAINVDLGIGDSKFTVWACDLTHGYIDINADYRS